MSLFRGESPVIGRGASLHYIVSETLQNGSATAANYGVFFIADRDYEVIEMSEAHTTAGTDAGTVTLALEKLTGTQAPDAGVNPFGTSTVNLKGTANTVQRLTKQSSTANNSRLKAGDRLCLKDSGTLTALVGVSVVVILRSL